MNSFAHRVELGHVECGFLVSEKVFLRSVELQSGIQGELKRERHKLLFVKACPELAFKLPFSCHFDT